MIFDELVKSRKYLFCHSGLDPESSSFQQLRMLWIPASARMTI